MLDQLAAGKWAAFEAALAKATGLALATYDAHGRLIASPAPPACLHYLDLLQSYRCTSDRTTTDAPGWSGSAAERSYGSQAVLRPCGLPAGLLAVDNKYLVLAMAHSPRPNDSDPGTSANAASPCQGCPMRLEGQQQSPGAQLSQEEFSARLESLGQLLGHLLISAHDTAEAGSLAVLLQAVEQLNRLILGLLDQERASLEDILDLVANSLVILLDSDASWVAVDSRATGWVAAASGADRVLAERIASAGQATEPPRFADPSLRQALILEQLGGHSSTWVESASNATACRLWAGALNPASDHAAMVLKTLASPVLVAAEIICLQRLLQQQTRSLLDAIRHAVLVFDTEGRCAALNQSARRLFADLGVDLTVGSAALGRGLSPAMEHGINSALQGEDVDCSQDVCSQHYLSWSARPVRDCGCIHGALIMAEDVTETTRLRDLARDWERLSIAGQLAAGLAHEIRSPLAAAVGAIQLILGGRSERHREEILARLQMELHRMNGILTGYLELAKPGESTVLRPVDISGCLREITFLLRSDALLHSVELVIDQPAHPIPYVIADGNALKQVFLNLARNGLEAMSDTGGRLVITVRVDGQALHVTFEDDGPGIPLGLEQQIFRPFFTTKPHGSGLGLSVSKELLESMGGAMGITSSPGRGTTASVVLPLVSQAVASSGTSGDTE